MKYPIIRSKSKTEKNENNRTDLYTKIAQPLPIFDKDKQIFKQLPDPFLLVSSIVPPNSPTSSDKTDRNWFNPTHNPFGLFRFSDKIRSTPHIVHNRTKKSRSVFSDRDSN